MQSTTLLQFLRIYNIWTLNPYHYCDHACTYCCNKKQGESYPILKTDWLLETLDKELAKVTESQEIMLGGMSDAYPAAERRYGVTRRVIEFLNQRHKKFVILSKSNLMERDLDLIKESVSPHINFSFSTLDDDKATHCESRVPPPSARLTLLKRLVAEGEVKISVTASPWMPQITDLETFLRNIPAGIDIRTGCLRIVRKNRTISLNGRIYTQAEIDDLFFEEKQRLSNHQQIRWMYCKDFSEAVYQTTGMHPFERLIRQGMKEDREPPVPC